MGQWEPLAEGIPVEVRRLATQLRRMKDRSGLTVPGLAARTAQPAESWSRALAGRHLLPLAAVEVLAQASGADYDRIGALWHLAEKADKAEKSGTADKAGKAGRAAPGPVKPGGGQPVPFPDPLDPLGPEEGVPVAGRRGFWLLAAVGVLAAAALAGVMLTAGASTGRAPVPPGAAPTLSVQDVPVPPERAAPSSPDAGTSPAVAPGRSVPGAKVPDRPSSGPHPVPSVTEPSSAAGSVPPGAGRAATPSGTTPAPPSSHSASSSPSPSAPSSPASPTASPPPSPTRTGLCLDAVVLDVCLG